MALTETGGIVLTSEDLTVALDAADPTDAWLLHEDGTTSLDPSDDISRFTVPGYWPRYLMRAGSVQPMVDREGGIELVAKLLTTVVVSNLQAG